ncbi:MAG: hypothetical protein ABSG94_12170 [Brevinematales bacterium]|jgi:hypothetical protein
MINGNFKYENRQLIPRWFIYKFASKLKETQPFNSTTKPKDYNDNEYIKIIGKWKEEKNLLWAIEVLSYAININDYDNLDVKIAAEFVLKNQSKISSLAAELAYNILNYAKIKEKKITIEPIDEHIKININKIKQALREYPTNPLLWTDLGYYYASLNQLSKAKNSINIAINLGYNNRFILRSASRFFVHVDECDKALFYLRKSQLAKIDPWIISAEISISEIYNKKSKLIDNGISIINNSGNYNKLSLSELLASIGTIELNHGSIKNSKLYFKRALVNNNDITENTLSQVEWISNKIGIDFNSKNYNVPFMFEANLWEDYKKENYNKSLESAQNLQLYLPFSANPSIIGSYIASVCLQNDEDAVKLLKNVLPKFHDNFLLRNNYAFSLANLNLIENAAEQLRSISVNNETELAILKATQGLIEFRKKNPEKGRSLYLDAIDTFKKYKDGASLARACLFYGREEFNFNKDKGRKYLIESINLSKINDMKEIENYAKSIDNSLKDL